MRRQSAAKCTSYTNPSFTQSMVDRIVGHDFFVPINEDYILLTIHLYIEKHNSRVCFLPCNLVSGGRNPFGQHQDSRALVHEKPDKKTAKAYWLLKSCSFHLQSTTCVYNQTGSRNSWFRFLNHPKHVVSR